MICLACLVPASIVSAQNSPVQPGTGSIGLVYPEDVAEFGDLQVLYLNRAASVAPDAGLLHGWQSNDSASFILTDNKLTPLARITSIAFTFGSASQSLEAMQSLSLPQSSWASSAMINAESVIRASGMTWRFSTYSPEPTTQQNVLLVQSEATVLAVFISVSDANTALGEQIATSLSNKIGTKTLKGAMHFVEPVTTAPIPQPSNSITPLVWSTTTSASYWSTYYDGNGAHIVAVWPNTIGASRPQFWYQDCVAYSPIYQCISQWYWLVASPAQLGVPDTTWLNSCLKADFWNCPSYADRNNIYNYTATVLYP